MWMSGMRGFEALAFSLELDSRFAANAPPCPLRGTSHAGKGSLIFRSPGGSL